MARDNIRKSKDSQKCKENTQNECLKYLKKNKNKLILGVICVIIMLIGIFLAIDKNNVYKKIPETIQNINNGKKESILGKKSILENKETSKEKNNANEEMLENKEPIKDEEPIIETKDEPNYENITFKKHNQELVEKLKNVNKKIYEFLSLTDIYKRFVDDEDIIEKIKNLREKYYTYLNITRFAIPVIGSVSVGKSTLLNYILDLKNLLETGTYITTNFFCIIRHNINYKLPVFSNITIEEREKFKYNFIKETILNKNEINYINEYNKFFSLKENKKSKIEEKYFLLVEVDIPFFHGEFEKYADLIEFIDIPGLNEIDSKKIKEENFYFSQLIPFIQPNYLFSIFLFKTDNIQHKDAKEILMNFIDVNYLDCVDENVKLEKELRKININKVFKESLFILNKENKKKMDVALSDFKDYLNKMFKKNKIDINLEENHNILDINLKKLNLELNRFESFEDYLNYSIETMDSSLIKSFVYNLNKDFHLDINYINISKADKVKLNDKEKQELNKINKISYKDKLKEGQYKKLYDLFKEKTFKKEINNNNKNNILIKLIKNKIQIMINRYLNIEEFYNLKLEYQNYFAKKGINDLEKKYNELIEIQNNNVSLKNPKEFIINFDKYMKELYKLKGDDNNENIDLLNEEFKEMKDYSSKKFLSSLLLIGEYSSGKSSFLNSLIGFNLNLLQVKSNECTKVAIIIRYTQKKDNIKLYSAKLKDNNKYGFYFEKDKLEAKGMLNVKSRIIELNKNKDLKYYILYTPIQAYDDLKLNMEIRNKIELIDFPGFASNDYNDKVEIEINKLLKKENGFIFVKSGKEFELKSSCSLINFINKIINPEDFYFINNCLFLFTNPHYYSYDMDEVKNNLYQIFDVQTIDNCMIKRKLNKKYLSKNKFIISTIDSPLYEDYMEFQELINNFTLFTEKLLLNYKESKSKNSFYEDLEFVLTNGNYAPFTEESSSLLNIKNNDIKKHDYILNNLLKKYSVNMKNKEKKLYLESYLKIKENKKLFLPYKNSNYEEAIQQFKKIISNSEIILNETLNNKIYKFSDEIFTSFNYIENYVLVKNLSITTKDVEMINKKLDEFLNNYKNIYEVEKSKIIKEFNLTENKLNEFSVNDFNYDKSNEIFEKSTNNMIIKYKDLIKDLDEHLNDHIEYFQNYSKKEYNSLKNDNKINFYFKNISKEYKQIIELIEQKRLNSKKKFSKNDYQEYNFFDSDEYKSSFYTKPFKLVKGIFVNFGHDYNKDKKSYSQKILDRLIFNFNQKKKIVFNSIANVYYKVDQKIYRHKSLYNSNWNNIIKNKSRYLNLTNNIIEFLNKSLYNN